MTKLLIVGCGDLGTKVAELLQDNGHQVIGVRQSANQIDGVACIQADVTKPLSLEPLRNIKPNILIYCVAANAQSDESYQLHYVEGLRNVLHSQKNNKNLQHVFFISSTRVYGQVVNTVMNENTKPEPNDFGGQRLLQAEALLNTVECSATVLRLSGIYGQNRLYLLRMVKDSSRWPIQDRWTNRIHRDDAANFLAFLCERVTERKQLEPCYIVTDHMPVKLSEVLGWMAKELNMPSPTFKENEGVSGKRLANQRMRDTGFSWQYPNYQVGYQAILKNV